MNKKTVLYIHHGKGLGGAPISLVNLMVGIKDAGFRPLVAFLHESQAVELFKNAGIETIGPINVMDFPHTKVYWFRWYHTHNMLRCFFDTLTTIFFIAPRLYEKIRPDIIHLNTSSLLGWGIAAWRKRIPLVWHIREPLANGYLGLRRAITQKIIASCATKIVAICKTDGSPWQDSPKLSVIYNAVNEKQFIPASTARTQVPTILFLGGIAEQKGTLLCLQAFEAVLQKIPTTRLILAGNNTLHQRNFILQKISGPAYYHERCLTLIEKMRHSITLTGPTTDVPALMKQCSVLVSPASVDHFARPVIEAGFMGIPALASDFAQQRELIVDKKTGLLLPPYAPEIWAVQLCSLLENEDLRIQLGRNAREFCKEQFALSLQVSKMVNVYNTLA
jgi:glycosyltransferase involved in cell wall biosynthesis